MLKTILIPCLLGIVPTIYAASVAITGDVSPSPAVTPTWNVGGDLRVGFFSGPGTLNVEAGGVVSNTNGHLGFSSGSEGTATVTGTGSQWINSSSLRVGNEGTGTLNVEAGGVVSNTHGYLGLFGGSEGTGTVTGAGSQWNNSGSLTVGLEGIGTLNVEAGGVVSNDIGSVGASADSEGTVTVTGAGSQWINSGSLFVGEEGTGTLNVEAGGVVSNTNGHVGFAGGSESTVTVTGVGSQWNNSGSLTVGSLGTGGTLNVEAGGVVSNDRSYLGYGPGAEGTVTVTGAGSQLNSSRSLRVGLSGTGTLNVEAGGVVSNADGSLGQNAGSEGTATVTGVGSQWNHSSFLNVGNSGTGTLNVAAGGVVSATEVVLANTGTSTGTLNLNGGTLSAEQLSEGSGSGGGTVSFDGGTLQLTGDQADLFSGFEAGDVTLVAGGGTIDTQAFTVASGLGLDGTGGLTKQGTGTLTLSSANTYTGGTTLSAGTLVIGNNSALGTGTLTIENGTILNQTSGFKSLANNLVINGNFTRNVGVGDILRLDGKIALGSGIRQITNNGWTLSLNGAISGSGGLTLAGPNLFIMGGTTANTYTGLTTVNGSLGLSLSKSAGTTAIAGDLLVSAGSRVQQSSASNLIADTSTVTVDGTYRLFGSSETIQTLLGSGVIEGFHTTGSDQTFTVGSGNFSGTIEDLLIGDTQLIKTGAGTLTLSGANTYRGGTIVRNGTLGVTGSITHSSADMILGNLSGDDGTLNVENGGVVSNTNGYVGLNAGSEGTATVTGAGSQWNHSGSLRVGNSGTGTLNVEAGGAVSNTSGYIGMNAGSTGTVTVSGGSWTNSNDLFVGFDDSGTLTISGTGLVTSALTQLAANTGFGTLNLDGGILSTGQVSEGSSSGTVNFNGGTLRLSADQANLFANFETGDVTLDTSGGTIDTQAFTVATSQILDGTGSLTKEGDGSLTLSGANTYSGGTIVAGGTLSLGSNTAAGTGTITTTGSVIDYIDGVAIANPININSDTTQLQVLTGSATQSGIISETGSARPLEKIGDGSLTLSGVNTYSGGTTLSAGTLVIGSDTSLGTGTLTIEDGTTLSQTSASRTLANDLLINGDFTRSVAGSANSQLTLNGDVDLGGGTRTVNMTSGDNMRFFGAISNGGLTFSNVSSKISFLGSSANTYTGTTTVNAGTLTLAKDVGVTAIAGDLVIASGAQAHLGSSNQIADTSSVTVDGIFNLFAASETIGSLTGLGTIFSDLGASTLGVGSGDFSGGIQDSGGVDTLKLVKLTAGTLTLSGSNTYSAGTEVNGGVLLVNNTTGSATGSGDVTVQSGGTLGGSGFIAGEVTIENGGRLAAGNSAGTLTTGALFLDSTSQLDYELDTPGVVGGGVNDLIVVNGDLQLDGILNITDLGGFGAGDYRLFNYTGALSDNGLLFGVLPGAFDLTVDTSTANEINLLVAAATSQFWNGASTSPNGSINGGTGTWDGATANWTNTNGNASSAWAGGLQAVFAGTAGTVTIADGFSADPAAIDFQTAGYTLAADGTGQLSLSSPTAITTALGTSVISAPITGNGGINKLGTGTLTLTGTNNYTGGTTVSNGTLQIGNGGTSGSIAGDITTNAALAFNRSDDLSYGGVVSGTGSLTQQGAGTVTLTGANTYTGGTTASSGTLQIGDGGTSGSIAGDITNNATLAFNRSNDLSYGGVVSGTGTLTQQGAGTLTLTRANTYTGTTIVNSGTLQIGNGGTSGSIAGDVTNNAALAFNRSDDLSYGGVVSGTGSLTQKGSGTLTLTGDSTYTGTTTVSGGSLLVNGSLGNTALTVQNGALLGGSGTLGGNVIIQNGGILSPGNSPGILTVAGDLNLNAGSVSNFEINGITAGAEYDQVVVGGTATLGGTLNLLFGITPSNGDTFTLIDATSITGDFDSVVNSLGNALVFDSSITDDYILSITAVQTDYATIDFTGGDPDLIEIANVLDGNFSNPNLLPIIDSLNGLPGTSLIAAFEQINPEELTVLSGMTFVNARNAVSRLGNRLREVRKGAAGFSTAGFNLYDANGQNINQSLIAGSEIPAGIQPQPYGDAGDSPLSYFISGSATVLDMDGDSNGPGFEDDNIGLLFGADYRSASDLSLGLYGGIDRSDTDFAGNGGNADLNTYRLGLTSTWWTPINEGRSAATQTLYTEAYLGAAYHDFDIVRNSFGGAAEGDTHATEVDTGLAIGYEIEYSKWTFTPELSLDYTHLWFDGYTETGGLSPLEIDDKRSDSLYSTVSFRADYKIRLAEMDLRPYVQIGWRHQYLDMSESVTARFAGGAGGNFTVSGARTSRDSLTGSLGISALFRDRLTAQLGYFGEYNSDFEVHSLNASIDFSF